MEHPEQVQGSSMEYQSVERGHTNHSKRRDFFRTRSPPSSTFAVTLTKNCDGKQLPPLTWTLYGEREMPSGTEEENKPET